MVFISSQPSWQSPLSVMSHDRLYIRSKSHYLHVLLYPLRRVLSIILEVFTSARLPTMALTVNLEPRHSCSYLKQLKQRWSTWLRSLPSRLSWFEKLKRAIEQTAIIKHGVCTAWGNTISGYILHTYPCNGSIPRFLSISDRGVYPLTINRWIPYLGGSIKLDDEQYKGQDSYLYNGGHFTST